MPPSKRHNLDFEMMSTARRKPSTEKVHSCKPSLQDKPKVKQPLKADISIHVSVSDPAAGRILLTVQLRQTRNGTWAYHVVHDKFSGWNAISTNNQRIAEAEAAALTKVWYKKWIAVKDRGQRSERRLIEGLGEVSVSMLRKIVRQARARLATIEHSRITMLMREHEIGQAEQSYVGVLLVGRQLSEQTRLFESTQEQHAKTMDQLKANDDAIRHEKCSAIAEQIESMQREDD